MGCVENEVAVGQSDEVEDGTPRAGRRGAGEGDGGDGRAGGTVGVCRDEEAV
jgi:hypothetical protein